jgi:beta-galactosidase
VNRVIIRSQPKSGQIILQARAAGLKGATIVIVSLHDPVTDGLSSVMPDAGLLSYLKRGPTPPPTELTLTRQPLRIVNVSAGANTEKANQSFDDNETTAWVSDGSLENGWIKYAFARPAPVSEVTLKLATGVRARTRFVS